MSEESHKLSDDGEGSGLTPRQNAVLACLVGGASAEEAAERTGAGERTIRRWLAEHEAFRRELKARQREAMNGVTRELQSAASEAVGTLKEVMGDASAPAAARVAAARVTLDTAYRAIELDEVVQRLEELEAAASRKEGP